MCAAPYHTIMCGVKLQTASTVAQAGLVWSTELRGLTRDESAVHNIDVDPLCTSIHNGCHLQQPDGSCKA